MRIRCGVPVTTTTHGATFGAIPAATLGAMLGATLCAGLLAATPMHAGPFDGVYVPSHDGRGADLSACAQVSILIAGDRVDFYEVACEIANPVQIRDMDALLYDGHCALRGLEKRGRVLIRRMASGDVALVTPFMDVRLAICDVAG